MEWLKWWLLMKNIKVLYASMIAVALTYAALLLGYNKGFEASEKLSKWDSAFKSIRQRELCKDHKYCEREWH